MSENISKYQVPAAKKQISMKKKPMMWLKMLVNHISDRREYETYVKIIYSSI